MSEIDTTGSPTHKGRGPVMQTYSGRAFYPLDPQPNEVWLSDIAHHLSLICRYNGAVVPHYSVAQHSVGVSYLIGGGPRQQMWGLMHDAAEAYIGDLTRPMKQVLDSVAPGAFAGIEARVMEAIKRQFDLGPCPHNAIKVADNIMAATEKRDVLLAARFGWGKMPAPLQMLCIQAVSPRDAEKAFLDRFADLRARVLSGDEKMNARFDQGCAA